nr:hypothetical protein [Tanacetum cinerariifolium]
MGLGFFSEIPMCGLMKTTSQSESSNTFFQIYSHAGNTLVQFMLCFEYAMEKQRYTQRVLDNASSGSNLSMFIELPFEKHAFDIRSNSDGNVETYIIRHRDKRSNTVIDVTVVFNQIDGSVTCSCGHYNRHGFLCRYVFCVFRIHGVDKIPDVYINRHWTKNVLPAHLLDKRLIYGPCIEESKRSKGTRRIKSAAEIGKAKTIARSNRKVHFKRRTCSACGGKGHNKATCKGCSACGPTRAHRLKVALVGGYDKVHGTSMDYCNFKRCINSFIGDRDAQILFWADETMKCNYVAFGDVVSFDATFHTNKYGYKFVPFTDIDHNQRCVTIDQDDALRKVVVKMFLDSHHQLCMWHITKKLLEKNVLPVHLLDKRHRYGPFIKETDTLASQVHQTVEECIGLFRNDTDKLSELLSTVQDLKKKLENEMQTPHVKLNKDALYYDLLDVTVPDKVVIENPKSIFRSKGTRRFKHAAKKGKAKTIARTNRKVPFKRRTCSACGGKGQNKATCEGCSACGEPGHRKGICKKFPNQDKGVGSGKNVVVDDEDEGDTDDQFNDEALGSTEDEVDEDDEFDEEYEIDEE